MPTTIKLKEETKANLDKQRLYPNEPFDDVVQRLITKKDYDDELSPETIHNIEQGVADIKAGRVYTTKQLNQELGL